MSGITLLSPHEKVAEKIRMCLLTANACDRLCSNYLAVVLGSPQPFSASTKVALTLQKNPLNEGDKKV